MSTISLTFDHDLQLMDMPVRSSFHDRARVGAKSICWNLSCHVRPITKIHVGKQSLLVAYATLQTSMKTEEVTRSQATLGIRRRTTWVTSQVIKTLTQSPRSSLEELLAGTSWFHYKTARRYIFSCLIAPPHIGPLLWRCWPWNPSSLEIVDSVLPSRK